MISFCGMNFRCQYLKNEVVHPAHNLYEKSSMAYGLSHDASEMR